MNKKIAQIIAFLSGFIIGSLYWNIMFFSM